MSKSELNQVNTDQDQNLDVGEVLNLVDNSKEQLNKIFNKRADKQKQTLPFSKISDLINDMSIELELDCEEAINFFNKNNPAIPQHIDLMNLTFNDFIIIFKLWLRIEMGGENIGDVEERMQEDTLNNQQNNQEEELQQIDQNQTQQLTNFEDRLAEFQQINSENIQQHFQEFLDEQSENKILANECFDFLKICFSESEFSLRLNQDSQDFFLQGSNSEKMFLNILQQYQMQFSENDNNMVTLDQCFQILNFWHSMDNNVSIIKSGEFQEENDHQEMQSFNVEEFNPNNKLEATLITTLNNYQNMINDPECSEIERGIIQNLINQLTIQLKELQSQSINADISKINQQQNSRRKVQIIPAPILTKEKREKQYREIYSFYTKQSYFMGKKATFERMEHESTVLTLGNWLAFCKHFQILETRIGNQDQSAISSVNNQTINDTDKKAAKILGYQKHDSLDRMGLMMMFKKTSSNNKELTYNQFLVCLEKISKVFFPQYSYEDRMEELDKFLGVDLQ